MSWPVGDAVTTQYVHDGLEFDELYYRKQPGREIKLNNHYRVHQRYEQDYDTFITFNL